LTDSLNEDNILDKDKTIDGIINSKSFKKRIKKLEEQTIEFAIDDFLWLRLEYGKTMVYVKRKPFLICQRLILDIPRKEFQRFENIDSIDEVAEIYDAYLMEKYNYSSKKQLDLTPIDPDLISPEEEFWGHCSVRHEAV